MERYLQTIADNTEAKDSFYVVATTNETSVVTSFSPPIIFRERSNGAARGGYEMALVGLNTYYSFPNIDPTKNYFRIEDETFHKHKWYYIVIPTGCYEVTSIDKEIWR